MIPLSDPLIPGGAMTPVAIALIGGSLLHLTWRLSQATGQRRHPRPERRGRPGARPRAQRSPGVPWRRASTVAALIGAWLTAVHGPPASATTATGDLAPSTSGSGDTATGAAPKGAAPKGAAPTTAAPNAAAGTVATPGVAVMEASGGPGAPDTWLPRAPSDPAGTAVGPVPRRDDPRPDGSWVHVAAPAAPSPGPVAAPSAGSPRTRVVAPGDHLWGIAESDLATRLGRPPSDDEVVPVWRVLVEVNRDRLVDPDNPDLIVPGQVVLLPD